MHSYLVLLLDLLEIEQKEPYLSLAKQLEDAPANATILFAHRANFMLSAYLDLLKGEIAPEEFVLLWDVDSAVPLWQQGQQTSQQVINALLQGEIPEQQVLVLDLPTWQVMLDQEQRMQIETQLTQQGKQLILG